MSIIGNLKIQESHSYKRELKIRFEEFFRLTELEGGLIKDGNKKI